MKKLLVDFMQPNPIGIAFLLSLIVQVPAVAGGLRHDILMSEGFTPIRVVSSDNIQDHVIPKGRSDDYIQYFCNKLVPYFGKYKWEKDPCGKVPWKTSLKTSNDNPLLYTIFGSGSPVTLVISGVHPDELTPVPMGFRFAQYLMAHPEVYRSKGTIVIAPLVNPDGFIRNVPSRTNANGIDPNRNFLTMDWYDLSKHLWRSQKNRRFRQFPGYFPNSEIETLFQIKLLEAYPPDRIVSVHAPLGFLDYDGPGDGKPRGLSRHERQAKELVHDISKKAHNYRVVDYSFYPGSLGNYAGNERNIPTVTLELKTTHASKVDEYWAQFLPGLVHAVQYDFKVDTSSAFGKNALFFGRYLRPDQLFND